MVKEIRGVQVGGIVDEKGRCPVCNAMLIVEDTNYRFIKNMGIAEFKNKERYIKCRKCSKFIMLPQKVA